MADALLEETRVSLEGDLNLCVNDKIRTYRIWTESSLANDLSIEHWKGEDKRRQTNYQYIRY